MKWKNMKVYQKLSVGFGSVILLLLFLSGDSIFTFNKLQKLNDEVVEHNKEAAFMLEKEIDHLKWMAAVNELFGNDQLTSLNVQTDDHKCGLGAWIYSDETKKMAAEDPDFAAQLEAIKEPHKNLHESAIQIKQNYTAFDLSLQNLIAARWIDHLNWIKNLQNSLQTKSSFSGGLDPHQCAFGQWFYAYQGNNPTFIALLGEWEEPHNRLHKSGEAIVKLMEQGNIAGAREMYKNETMVALADLETRYTKTRDWIDAQANGQKKARAIFASISQPAANETQQHLARLKEYFDKEVALFTEHSKASNESSSQMILLVSCFALLTGIFVAWIITRSITIPIRKTMECGLLMAQGNFSQKIAINQTDELGQMGQALNQMIENIQDKIAVAERVANGDLTAEANIASDKDQLGIAFQKMVTDLTRTVGEIQHSAGNLAGSSQEMSAVASQLGSSAEEMSSQANNVAGASEQMTQNMTTMASSTEEMSSNITIMASRAEEISQSMETVAAAVEEMNASIQEISSRAQEGVQVSNQAEEMSVSATTTMRSLGESATEIGQVTEVIKRIAEQTNLLALNATIEAASAGEAGKGFAVVANEIKELANQSAQAAEDIANRIGGVQGNTENAVEVISKVAEIIAQLKQATTTINLAVDEQGRTVREIAENINEVNIGTRDIASSVSEMATGAADVSKNTGETSMAVEDVSVNIHQVSQAAQETSNGAQQISSASEELTAIADALNELVSTFKVRIFKEA